MSGYFEKEPTAAILDGGRARDRLGFEAKINWRDMVAIARCEPEKKGMSRNAPSFGCNTYFYAIAYSAADCLVRLAELGFEEFELMMYPGHL